MRSLIASLVLAGAWLAGCEKAPARSAASAASQSCVACHGADGSSAPPRTTRGETAATALGVGAHTAHLAPGPFGKAVSCDECHRVPKVAKDPGHDDGVIDVAFGAVAASGGARPTWDRATGTCASTYCHGATLHGGTRTAPLWNASDPKAEVGCGGCHAIPPEPATGHPRIDAAIPGYTASPSPSIPSTLAVCGTCHPDTVGEDGQLDVEGGRHIDGVLQTGAFACARCHGDPADTSLPVALRPAPPRGVHGETSTTARAVGAHQVHLRRSDLAAEPVGCGECHPVPTSMRDHPNPAYTDANRLVALRWGPLARAGGAAPAWSAATLTCTSTYCHGSTLSGGTDTAPRWTRVDGTQRACTSCHGLPPPTPVHAQDAQTNPAPADCDRCHAGYSLTAVVRETHLDGLVNVTGAGSSGAARTCTGCHGDASRGPTALRPAPPTGVGGATSTRARGVGAHLAHLTGIHVSGTRIACGECHPPVTRTDHAAQGGYELQLAWGPLASAGLSHPRYDAQTLTCSNTYCHGSTLAGGSVAAPVWNEVTGDPAARGSQVACGSCHGIPPPAPHVASVDCGTCHTGFTNQTVNLALHVDGDVDVSGGSCTTCHGDPARTPGTLAAAPPVEARLPSGAPAPWAGDGASGAHLKHLVAGPLAPAIACAECHALPSAAPKGAGDAHGDGRATLAFGRLATTDGASPAFDAGRGTCAGTYCHGSTLGGGTLTAPAWTRTDGSQVVCGTCHGVPPRDVTHDAVASGTSCGDCHKGYGGTQGGAAGTFTVNTALHVNGVVDATGGSCTSCHGTKGRALVAGADPQAASAPPADARGFSAAGAHLAHLNKGTGAMGKHVACNECHAVPASAPRGGADPHGDGKASVRFGNLSKTGGRSPAFDASTLTCGSTWCHGGAQPRWNAGGPLSCTACHANPPQDACHTFRHEASSGRCNGCHRNVNASGTAITGINQHVDGVRQGQCSECHRGALSCTNRGDDD